MSRVTKARVVEMVVAFESCGHPVRGLRLIPDGSVELLTDVPADHLASNDVGDWVALAGKTALPRA